MFKFVEKCKYRSHGQIFSSKHSFCHILFVDSHLLFLDRNTLEVYLFVSKLDSKVLGGSKIEVNKQIEFLHSVLIVSGRPRQEGRILLQRSSFISS